MIPLCPQTGKLFAPLPSGLLRPEDRFHLQLDRDGKHFTIELYRQLFDENGRPYRGRAKQWAKQFVEERIPEKKDVKKADREAAGLMDAYKVGATDCTVELIAQLVPPRCVHFADEDTERVYKSILHQSQLADDCARLLADYKLNKVVTQHNFELNAEYPLFPYQQVALAASSMQDGFLLSMQQGTGKTPIAIASVCNGAVAYRDSGAPGYYKAIVVCPNNLRLNWHNEFCKYATRPGRVTIVSGQKITREKQIIDAFARDPNHEIYFTVLIIGYQTLWRTWETLGLVQWDQAIADEAHMICSVNAEQSKGMMRLRDNSHKRLALTGTPIKNSPLDIYNILEWLEPGGSGFADHANFRKFYGTFDRAPSGHDIVTGFQNLPILQERLARKSFFISLKEAQPNLPEKTYDVVEVELNEDQDKAYRELQKNLAIEIENTIASGKNRQMLVQCILTQLLRLSQISSGFASWDAVTDEFTGEVLQPKFWEPLGEVNPKVETVLDMLLAKEPDEKTIIWANWVPDIETLAHACEYHKIGHAVFRGLHKGYTDADRQESVRRFNEDRDCKVFIGTAASGGTGLNLLGYPPGRGDEYTTNCNHTIYYSQDWSYVKRNQSEFRNYRTGVRVPTRFTTLLGVTRREGMTIDHEIHQRVTKKHDTAVLVADLTTILKVALDITLSDQLSQELLVSNAI